MLKTVVFIAIVCVYPLVVRAQKWTPRYIAMTSKTAGYYEYLPEGYTSDGTVAYPLILYIHGNSERGAGDSVGLLKIIGGGLPNVMSQSGFPRFFVVNNQMHRFLVVAPQFAPRPDVLDIDSVLNYVLAHYPVDLNRIYLTGFSMGGGSCWDYAGSVPALANKLAALVPVSGSGTPDTLKTRTIARANLPVWATHNDADPSVPVSTTTTYVDWINQAPAPTPLAKKTIFHAASHNAWAATYNPAFKEGGLNIFEWMLQYQRRPAPAYPKQIKVNIYGGINPYDNLQWNDWNVVASLRSGTLRYTDATVSTISAVLSKSSGVNDNSTTYGSGMAPAEVLRYTSNASTARTLTLTGLSTLKTYNLELYGSRNNYNGYVTVYTVNGSSQNISTYKNLTAKAGFNNLKPDANGQLAATISSVNAYNYINGFTLTEASGPVNQTPVASAGTDKTIILPTNSIILTGSGHDNDGTIRSYKWMKTSGPIPFTIHSPTAATTTVSGLTEGIYTFRLSVTDNAGAAASDDVQVTVNTASTTKTIKVNIYGGTNAYANTQWNNWNVLASLTSGSFKYTDGSPSTISATIARNGVADNGATYGSGMAPAEVLRYSCYATALRTLTFSGLSSSKTYTIELYASRNAYPDNSTVFTINGISKTIATYQNLSNNVRFNDLMANTQGQILITISGTKTYNYLNGFTLTENNAATVTSILFIQDKAIARQPLSPTGSMRF